VLASLIWDLPRIEHEYKKTRIMKTAALAGSIEGKLFINLLAAAMESRLRYRLFPPVHILEGAGILPGQIVLEIGCGTGYFTLPAARLIGGGGFLVAIDVLSESIELVTHKVETAGLKNVRMLIRDALDTGLDGESFDRALLFGVIPSPMLPLTRLLPEMHRLLNAEGSLAVWPPIPGWLPQSILQSGLFTFTSKRNGVHNFRQCQSKAGKHKKDNMEDRAPHLCSPRAAFHRDRD
jgi:SAM-dependent methyltransferase